MESLDEPLLSGAHALCRDPAFREAVWRHHRFRREDSELEFGIHGIYSTFEPQRFQPGRVVLSA